MGGTGLPTLEQEIFFYNVQQKVTTVQTTSMKIWTYLIQCLLHALTDMLL